MWAIVLIPLLTAFFAKLIGVLGEFLVRLLLVHKELRSDQMVRELDKYLLEKATDHDVSQGSTKRPTDSWHLRRVGWGFLVAMRQTKHEFRDTREWYSLYGTKKVMTGLVKRLAGEPDQKSSPASPESKTTTTDEEVKIEVSNFESASPWQTSFDTSFESLPSARPYDGQAQVVDTVVREYQRRLLHCDKKRLSVLVTGEPGTGKTNLGLFLAHRLKGRVVFGYDLTAPGISLGEMWKLCPSRDSPVILVLDEIDTALKFADENKETKDAYRCLAQNKTALNTLFDRFERTRYLIVVGTSNVPFQDLWSKYRSGIRKGRFDLCYTLHRTRCQLENNE